MVKTQPLLRVAVCAVVSWRPGNIGTDACFVQLELLRGVLSEVLSVLHENRMGVLLNRVPGYCRARNKTGTFRQRKGPGFYHVFFLCYQSASSRIQTLRYLTGLPWSCSEIGPLSPCGTKSDIACGPSQPVPPCSSTWSWTRTPF